MTPSRNPYPTDVSDEEWAFVAPYLMLLPEDAGQRTHGLREVFHGLRWIVRAGAPWRMMVLKSEQHRISCNIKEYKDICAVRL